MTFGKKLVQIAVVLLWSGSLAGCFWSSCSDANDEPDVRHNVAEAGPDIAAARPYEKQTVVLDSNIICWRHLAIIPQQDALRTIYADFSASVSIPLDLSVVWYMNWSELTEETSTTLSEPRLTASRQWYTNYLDQVTNLGELGNLEESLGIMPCHALGTIGGHSALDQQYSRCNVSPILPEHHAAFAAFVNRAATAFVAARQGTGPFYVHFGGFEMPREVWKDPEHPEQTFMTNPTGYLELARAVLLAVQKVAPAVTVGLRLPGIETQYLQYMHYEDTAAGELQLAYSDGSADKVFSRATIEAMLTYLFERAFSTGELDAAGRQQLLLTNCEIAAAPQDEGYFGRKALCEFVQGTTWIRGVLAAIPEVFGQSAPLQINMHLYGGGYREQIAWAGPDGAVQRALLGHPNVTFIVYEQGSPFSPMRESELSNLEHVYSELAKDIPKIALSLLASKVRKLPIRSPVSEADYWPEFGLYGMTETDGVTKRASYYATFPLLQLLGGQTQGATLISGVLDDQIEVHQIRPADGRAPTFVLWSRDDQPHEVKVRLSVATGIQILESPTAAAPTVPSTICAGSDMCSLTVTDVPLYLSGTDSLEFVH